MHGLHVCLQRGGTIQTFPSWIKCLHFKTREVILCKLAQYQGRTFSTIKALFQANQTVLIKLMRSIIVYKLRRRRIAVLYIVRCLLFTI
jgi:hypothetical protein